MATRRKKFAARARAIGRAAASPRSSVMQTVGGAAAYFLHKVASDNLDFVRNNWYAGPAALAVIGHAVKRTRFREVGAALCGAAGYAGALAFKLRESQKQNQPAETGIVYDTSGLQGRELPDNTMTSNAPELEAMYPDTGMYVDDADVSSAMNLGM